MVHRLDIQTRAKNQKIYPCVVCTYSGVTQYLYYQYVMLQCEVKVVIIIHSVLQKLQKLVLNNRKLATLHTPFRALTEVPRRLTTHMCVGADTMFWSLLQPEAFHLPALRG